MNRFEPEYDSYAIEEPSDEEPGHSSSEDELDVLLHGTPTQKRKLIRECLTGESESSSDDEFEKEMENELSSTIKTMEVSWKPSTQVASSSCGAPSAESSTQQYYDDIYFDSDSDEEINNTHGSKERRQKKRQVLTNDELLYDPKEDDRDQEWVDARRRGYRNIRKSNQTKSQQTKEPALPNSDAVLNCPACMTTLCLDCQRHESYKTQYRAMFVMNCSINKEELLRFPNHLPAKHKRRHRKKTKLPPAEEAVGTTSSKDTEEMYHPVKCTECSTEVAVYDKDEVYHFFNVLASHC
ncbi:E2F-associated phosphoprotein [Bombina bombina]|uniref:E2F-associated phosphoprotein n=1 Tax=Bombina bombina TaxID=8345 RepID=UPI00235A72C3|nr:E2F-associated phosphoprotein [Bombina bombina]XP_053553724.1 E2F-associated phosphoprotein [Bombina bombina]